MPKWLRNVMPEAWEVGPHVREDAFGRVARWQAVAFSDTVRRTCAKCNNGWMHDLETHAQPLVTPLIHGQAETLDPPQVRIMAFWLAKTVMMLSCAHQGALIPAAHYRELYARQEPPRQCLVSIGCAADWRREISDFHFPLRLSGITETTSGAPNAYAISLRVGRFMAQVIGHIIPNAIIYPETSRPDVMTEIWPSVRPLNWPPAKTISDADADVVMRMFPEP